MRQRDRAPIGLEPQPAQSDQGNWSGQLPQTLAVLVYLPGGASPTPHLGKGRKFLHQRSHHCLCACCLPGTAPSSFVGHNRVLPALPSFLVPPLATVPLPSASAMPAVFLALEHTEAVPGCLRAAAPTAFPLSLVRLVW